MKKFIYFLAFICPTKSFAQNLEIFGSVFGSELKSNGKIYYIEQGNKFKKTQYINYDIKKKFMFLISLENIKKENIKVLTFSLDTTSNSVDDNACTQKIFINEIINSNQFINKKSISIYSDLNLVKNCEKRSYSDAKMFEKDKFVGKYKLIKNDTTIEINLMNQFQSYSSNFTIQNSKFMDKEFGYWDYDVKNKILLLVSKYQFNEKFGILKVQKQINKFSVKETSNGFEFLSKQYSFTTIVEEIVQYDKELAEEGSFLDYNGKPDSWELFLTQNMKLFYPEEYKSDSLKGEVKIFFFLNSDGTIQKISYDKNKFQEYFEFVKAAQDLIQFTNKRWSIKATNGKIVTGWRYKIVTFSLSKK